MASLIGLKEQAKLSGFLLTRAQPPPRLVLLDRHTGKTVFEAQTPEEIETALQTLEPSVPLDVIAESVGWSTDVPVPRPVVPVCGNGWGPDCLCLDPMEDLIIFCPIPGCQLPAACLGACIQHYASVKIFGDQTQRAITETQRMIEQYLDDDPDGLSTYERAVKNLEAGILTHVSMKLGSMIDTSASSLNRTALREFPGVIIRPVGDQYAVVDRDGVVLASGPDAAQLLKDFLLEDE